MQFACHVLRKYSAFTLWLLDRYQCLGGHILGLGNKFHRPGKLFLMHPSYLRHEMDRPFRDLTSVRPPPIA